MNHGKKRNLMIFLLLAVLLLTLSCSKKEEVKEETQEVQQESEETSEDDTKEKFVLSYSVSEEKNIFPEMTQEEISEALEKIASLLADKIKESYKGGYPVSHYIDETSIKEAGLEKIDLTKISPSLTKKNKQ